MLLGAMKPHGLYKIARRRRPNTHGLSHHPASQRARYDPLGDPVLGGSPRLLRLLDSLRDQIVSSGDGANVRVRQVFSEPQEIFRLELELPELGYQRTTLLDREALEELLEIDEVRAIIHSSTLRPSSESHLRDG
jgi:hypothetical protein